MQLYDITIAANTTRQLDAPGSYFYYYAGSAGGADSTITLRGVSSGLRLILKPGQAFRLPKGDVETSWILTNYANTATIIGSVMVGDGDITDNRVTGSVEVVDGGKNRTLSGSSFMSGVWTNSQAGQYSHAQLWNPIANTKRVIVEKLYLTSAASGTVDVGIVNTALTTLNGNVYSKLSGASASSAQMKSQFNASIITASVVSTCNITANTVQVIELREPIVLTPGYGINAAFFTLSNAFTFGFEFFEEQNT